MRRRIKTIQIHESLYDKMEQLRLAYAKQNLKLSQIELTGILAKKIKISNIDLLGVKNVKPKKR